MQKCLFALHFSFPKDFISLVSGVILTENEASTNGSLMFVVAKFSAHSLRVLTSSTGAENRIHVVCSGIYLYIKSRFITLLIVPMEF